MKLTKRHMNKGFTLVELLVVIAIIAALAAMATPVIMKQNKKAAMTEATSNAKQVFYLMVEFDQDYGAFPNNDTASEIGVSGTTSSNDYLSQFIEGGYTKSEEIFFAKGGSTPSKKPDNVITADSMLEKGECGFAYIKDQSTSVNTGRPILVAPYDSSFAFKPDPYDGKAVVLRVDGAVKQLLLDKDTKKAKIGGGKTLFDTTGDTVWGGETVQIAEPESN